MQFHTSEAVFDEHRHWTYRATLASISTTTGAIVRAMLAKNPRLGPAYGNTADIDPNGIVLTDVRDGYGRWLGPRPIGHIRAVRDNLRRLADHCKFSDSDREALFEELRKWIRRDHRARSEN